MSTAAQDYQDAKARMEHSETRQRHYLAAMLALVLIVTVAFNVLWQVQNQHNHRTSVSTQQEILAVVNYIKKTQGPEAAAQEAQLLDNVEHCIIDESAHSSAVALPFPLPPGCSLGKVIVPRSAEEQGEAEANNGG